MCVWLRGGGVGGDGAAVGIPNEMQCGSGGGTLTETRGDGGGKAAAHCGALAADKNL